MGILSSIFDILLKDNELSDKEKDPSQSKIKHYLDSFRTSLADLEGPFLPEQQAIKDIDRYKRCLCETYYEVNCLIGRHILVLSNDQSLNTRDNTRLELGITPFNHIIGLHIEKNDFSVLEIDRNILLNPNDRMKVKCSIVNCPPTELEIKSYAAH